MAKQGIISVMMNIEMEFCFGEKINDNKCDTMLKQSLKATFFKPIQKGKSPKASTSCKNYIHEIELSDVEMPPLQISSGFLKYIFLLIVVITIVKNECKLYSKRKERKRMMFKERK